MGVVCKRCQLFEQDEGELLSTLKAYIASLDEEDKVPQEVYEKRLSKCEGCDSLGNGMCEFCGCFVIVRAIKKIMSCPHPRGERWEKMIEEKS